MTLKIRPAEAGDYARIAAIINQIDPEPVSGESLLKRDQELRQKPEISVLRLVAEAGDMLLGYGVASYSRQAENHRWYVRVNVEPAARGQGAGTALLKALEARALENGAVRLNSVVPGGEEDSFQWAVRRGYAMEHQRTESVLDLSGWDGARFAGAVTRAEAAGIRLETYHGLPERLYRTVWETEEETAQDHPEYEEPGNFDRWVEGLKMSPRPMFWALAWDGEHLAGYSMIQMPIEPGQGAYTGYTCVRRPYRGRGIALAVKVLTVEAAVKAGAPHMRTNNNPENGPMLAVNDKLGYKLVPGPRSVKKLLKQV